MIGQLVNPAFRGVFPLKFEGSVSEATADEVQMQWQNEMGYPMLHGDCDIKKTFLEEDVAAFGQAVTGLTIDHLRGLSGSIADAAPDQEGNDITVPGIFVSAQITRAFVTWFKELAERFGKDVNVFPVYANQILKFLAPVHVGDTVDTHLTVQNISYKQSRQKPEIGNIFFDLDTDIIKMASDTQESDEPVIQGDAQIIIRVPHNPDLGTRINAFTRPEYERYGLKKRR